MSYYVCDSRCACCGTRDSDDWLILATSGTGFAYCSFSCLANEVELGVAQRQNVRADEALEYLEEH